MSNSVNPVPTQSRRASRLVRIVIAAALFTIPAAGLWWYLQRDQLPDPPAIHTQDGADPAVVAAIEKARQEVFADRHSTDHWGDLGLVFGAHGYEAEANQCFIVAEKLNPTEPRWPYLRGVFALVNQPSEAVPLFRKALALNPADAMAREAVRMKLAESLLERREFDEAESLFREQVRESPGDVRPHLGLGQIALIRGDRVAAKAEFAPIADGPFTKKRASSYLAALARADGNPAEAARFEQVSRAAREDLPWPDPYLRDMLVRSVGQQGRLKEAERLETAGRLPQAAEMLVEMAQADPSPRMLSAAAMALTKLGEYQQAEEMLRECLRRHPHHSQSEYYLAIVLFERAQHLQPKQPEEARDWFRKAAEHARQAVATKPDHGLAWLYLGRSLLSSGDAAAAIEPLRLSVACRPEFVDPHLYLAEALAAVGKKEEAIRSAKDAQELAGPGETRPRQFLERMGQKVR
ncbi:MAG TPA: tetratricopeptide repeat protein [Urbifossiella sp.]|jgi:tetratricopeptide (TPR) repeat protein